jgi:cation diffusion facilitator CzcD-associated flavoprotein CzcO
MKLQHIPNLIIGGGLSGLNLSLKFSKRKIDSLILEAGNAPGGQWSRFPVCGRLISLNKRYVPHDNHHYRMRLIGTL